jgi:hypothetical protein
MEKSSLGSHSGGYEDFRFLGDNALWFGENQPTFGGTCLQFAVCIMIVYCLAYFSVLKMVTACPSEMSVDFHRTTWRHISEGRILCNKLTVKSDTSN